MHRLDTDTAVVASTYLSHLVYRFSFSSSFLISSSSFRPPAPLASVIEVHGTNICDLYALSSIVVVYVRIRKKSKRLLPPGRAVGRSVMVMVHGRTLLLLLLSFVSFFVGRMEAMSMSNLNSRKARFLEFKNVSY
jgi:hypothetical protein